MHATIQKPLDEIVRFLKGREKVFVVGCGNCAEKYRSGGEKQTKEMKERLGGRGIEVTGYGATTSGSSLCKLSTAEKLLNEEDKDETKAVDSFLVLTCGQGCTCGNRCDKWKIGSPGV